MKITSINTSLPKDIVYQGKSLSTGIFKTPVPDAVSVSCSGLAGDEQCDLVNHGGAHKAVYGFALKHYDYWREQLPAAELQPGAFGENLTIDDLDESRICIGDRLQIGTVILEVSQPRVPCFKLGIALGDERAAEEFTSAPALA